MRARDGGRDDKEFMATLAKGLAVLGTFDKARPAMTLSQAAQATGLSRATARRILRTLTELGYVAAERAAVLAFVRHSQAGLRLSRNAELDRAGFAADAAARRAIP